MSLYRVMLAEGQKQDLMHFLDKDLLVAQWPVLRRLVSRHLRIVWEDAFPELAAARSTGAAQTLDEPACPSTWVVALCQDVIRSRGRRPRPPRAWVVQRPNQVRRATDPLASGPCRAT